MASNQMQQYLAAINPYGVPKTQAQLKKNLAGYIAPVQLQRLRQDVQMWRDAVIEAENAWYPHRVKMQRLYIDTINNGHVWACWDRRRDLTLLRKCEFVDADGNPDDKTTEYFQEMVDGKSQNKTWFNEFLQYTIDSIGFGYSLIALGDIVDDGFPNMQLIKRWNVSPDRMNVTNFTYSISGALFMQEPYLNWHVYIPTVNEIGTSPSGYGIFYKVAVYEIFLRNILGFNGDFVELYAQPYRVGKTTKTAEKDRETFFDALQQMGSSGFAMIDPQDQIEFIETKLGGTGYNGYDNFEQRLEKKISKIILGHADALDSIPGKLGNSKEKSPAELAMEDKQTKDGVFVAGVVNQSLLPKMRKLGFDISPDVKMVFKNDAEIMETNNSVIAQAVQMHQAGLMMEGDYFTEQTGIPISDTPEPVLPSIKNKLDKMYKLHD